MVVPSHTGVYHPSTPFWHIEIRDRRLQRLLAQLKVPTECRLSLWAGSSERCFESDYDGEVYNGDLGVVSGIDMEEGELLSIFDGRAVSYGFGELDELVLAYATTIHKSQGSEYPAVVIPLSTQHYAMLQRNLVYTGVTREEEHCTPKSLTPKRCRCGTRRPYRLISNRWPVSEALAHRPPSQDVRMSRNATLDAEGTSS